MLITITLITTSLFWEDNKTYYAQCAANIYNSKAEQFDLVLVVSSIVLQAFRKRPVHSFLFMEVSFGVTGDLSFIENRNKQIL